jgi:ribA/ribD-fused uncharacterized protein
MTTKYLFFWGHRPQPDGSAGPGCLSQWWPAAFTIEGREYATAEHWMMWSKAMLFGDADVAARVLEVTHPNEAKSWGRKVRGFDEERWTQSRYAIVVAGSVAKFGQNRDLGRYLLGTGDRVLVEASPLDRIWGIGLAANDPRAADPERWLGLNLLGKALMEARSILRETTSATTSY